jgi:hypothetical protein
VNVKIKAHISFDQDWKELGNSSLDVGTSDGLRFLPRRRTFSPWIMPWFESTDMMMFRILVVARRSKSRLAEIREVDGDQIDRERIRGLFQSSAHHFRVYTKGIHHHSFRTLWVCKLGKFGYSSEGLIN